MENQADLSIGLFDSGVGGLTVFRAVRDLLPDENIIYLGDTARVPYGTKSPDTIVRYTSMVATRLGQCGIKMLVIACNTATSAALPYLREHFAPLPVIGVIEPGAHAAAQATSNGRIAVIATEATIRGGAYQKAIGRILPDASVFAQACTLMVPLAEEGWLDGPLVEGIARRYLDPIFSQDTNEWPDTLLLGCTHFPLLIKPLGNILGPRVSIVDSASATAAAVKEELGRRNLLRLPCGIARKRFMTTDNPERFARTGSLFLGAPLSCSDIEVVDI